MARNYSNMTDLPLAPRGKDSLGADNYVTALANFISRVETFLSKGHGGAEKLLLCIPLQQNVVSKITIFIPGLLQRCSLIRLIQMKKRTAIEKSGLESGLTHGNTLC